MTQLRRFLGAVSFYRRFVKLFSQIARPLHQLTCKHEKFDWTPECQKAFDTLRKEVTSNAVLVYPNFQKEFILATDASTQSIGATLSQYDENNVLRPVCFPGRSLTKAEKAYSSCELEILAVTRAVNYFNVYLQGVHFELWTDNSALTWLLKKTETTPRLARWALIVQGYDFTVKHIKGKHNVVPDALSRRDYPYSHTKEDDDLDAFPDLSCILVDIKATQTSSFDLEHTNPVSEVPKTRHVQFSRLLHVTFYYDPEVAIQSNTTPDRHAVSVATNTKVATSADTNAINTTLEPTIVYRLPLR